MIKPSLSRAAALVVSVTLFVALGAGPVLDSAQAQTPALDLGSDAELGSNFNQNEYSLGWKFTTNQQITVSALGFYDEGKNGLAVSHPVGIYDALDCALVASTTVTTSDTLIGYFRYHDIVPVTLQAGKTYLAAGLTTAPDKYLLNPPTLNADSSITFGGFTIFGSTQQTSTLQCPNGSSSASTRGDFGPNFLIGGSGISPTPTPTPGSGKRPTRLNLFCNRTGVLLEVAKCSATVADAGPQPVSLPTGVISFVASGGFFPASGSCFPTQTQYSPGIGSCEATFQVPNGFPIGAKFPIDATYEGNASFDASSTSHKLIVASCVGTTAKPCKNSIGLDFPDQPQIIEDTINALLLCGGGSGTGSAMAAETPRERRYCALNASGSIELANVLDHLTPDEFRRIAGKITTLQAGQVFALANYRKLATTLTDSQLTTLLRTGASESNRNVRLVKALEFGTVPKSLKAEKLTLNAMRRARAKSGKKGSSKILLGKIKAKLNAGTQTDAQFKLSVKSKVVIEVFRSAGYDELPLTLDLISKLKDKKERKSSSTIELQLD